MDNEKRTIREVILELEATLTRFHQSAESNPDLWHDARASREAFSAACELCDADYSLHRSLLQSLRRERAERYHATQGGREAEYTHVNPRDSTDANEARAFEAREAFHGITDHLRNSSESEARRWVRGVDRQRIALLRWLLDSLAEVRPETAQAIGNEWTRYRAARASSQEGVGPPDEYLIHRARPGQLERWERRTADQLTLFLGPLLPR